MGFQFLNSEFSKKKNQMFCDIIKSQSFKEKNVQFYKKKPQKLEGDFFNQGKRHIYSLRGWTDIACFG